jgi:hypothetical protein
MTLSDCPIGTTASTSIRSGSVGPLTKLPGLIELFVMAAIVF